MKDKHDPRDFEQFVKLNDDGTVASSHMVAVGEAPPKAGDKSVFLNVSALGAIPFEAVTVDPALVATMKQRAADLETAALAHAQAFADHATAERTALEAFTVAAVSAATKPVANGG